MNCVINVFPHNKNKHHPGDGFTLELTVTDGFTREFVQDLALSIAKVLREETDRFNDVERQSVSASGAWEDAMTVLSEV